MLIEYYPCVVIGAGVIGISVARALAQKGLDVMVLEAADQIGTETSSRNSEVIHAGLYYPPGSLKASLCVQGKHRLYDYCDERRLSYRRCGKLIVATAENQIPALRDILGRAQTNGVDDLAWLDANEVARLEPDIRARCALFSPSTGIIDSHQLMLSLQGEAEASGALFVMRSPVLGGEIGDRGIMVEVGGEQPSRLCAQYLVNAAGIWAPRVAAGLRGLSPATVPSACFAKGNYFALTGRSRFRHLIYPIPEPGGLGVHITLDLGGQVRFGPDVEWTDSLDYRVNPQRADRFYQAVRQYWPGLRDGSLVPAYAGIRPKIRGPAGEPMADFMIQGAAQHGVKGLINLFGIESPGLTACLALADEVANQLLS